MSEETWDESAFNEEFGDITDNIESSLDNIEFNNEDNSYDEINEDWNADDESYTANSNESSYNQPELMTLPEYSGQDTELVQELQGIMHKHTGSDEELEGILNRRMDTIATEHANPIRETEDYTPQVHHTFTANNGAGDMHVATLTEDWFTKTMTPNTAVAMRQLLTDATEFTTLTGVGKAVTAQGLGSQVVADTFTGALDGNLSGIMTRLDKMIPDGTDTTIDKASARIAYGMINEGGAFWDKIEGTEKGIYGKQDQADADIHNLKEGLDFFSRLFVDKKHVGTKIGDDALKLNSVNMFKHWTETRAEVTMNENGTMDNSSAFHMYDVENGMRLKSDEGQVLRESNAIPDMPTLNVMGNIHSKTFAGTNAGYTRTEVEKIMSGGYGADGKYDGKAFHKNVILKNGDSQTQATNALMGIVHNTKATLTSALSNIGMLDETEDGSLSFDKNGNRIAYTVSALKDYGKEMKTLARQSVITNSALNYDSRATHSTAGTIRGFTEQYLDNTQANHEAAIQDMDMQNYDVKGIESETGKGSVQMNRADEITFSQSSEFKEYLSEGMTVEEANEVAKESWRKVNKEHNHMTPYEVHKARIKQRLDLGLVSEQGTQGWLDIKRGKMSASIIDMLDSKSQDAIDRNVVRAAFILEAQTKPKLPNLFGKKFFHKNAAVNMGSKKEAKVDAAFSKATGLRTLEGFFEGDETTGASPDGYAYDAVGDAQGLVEYKVHDSHKAFLAGKKKYTAQAQWQMHKTNEDKVHLFRMNNSGEGEDRFAYDIIERDQEHINKLQRAVDGVEELRDAGLDEIMAHPVIQQKLTAEEKKEAMAKLRMNNKRKSNNAATKAATKAFNPKAASEAAPIQVAFGDTNDDINAKIAAQASSAEGLTPETNTESTEAMEEMAQAITDTAAADDAAMAENTKSLKDSTKATNENTKELRNDDSVVATKTSGGGSQKSYDRANKYLNLASNAGQLLIDGNASQMGDAALASRLGIQDKSVRAMKDSLRTIGGVTEQQAANAILTSGNSHASMLGAEGVGNHTKAASTAQQAGVNMPDHATMSAMNAGEWSTEVFKMTKQAKEDGDYKKFRTAFPSAEVYSQAIDSGMTLSDFEKSQKVTGMNDIARDGSTQIQSGELLMQQGREGASNGLAHINGLGVTKVATDVMGSSVLQGAVSLGVTGGAGYLAKKGYDAYKGKPPRLQPNGKLPLKAAGKFPMGKLAKKALKAVPFVGTAVAAWEIGSMAYDYFGGSDEELAQLNPETAGDSSVSSIQANSLNASQMSSISDKSSQAINSNIKVDVTLDESVAIVATEDNFGSNSRDVVPLNQ